MLTGSELIKALASIPLFGALGTITVHAQAAAPVDSYRSLLSGEP